MYGNHTEFHTSDCATRRNDQNLVIDVLDTISTRRETQHYRNRFQDQVLPKQKRIDLHKTPLVIDGNRQDHDPNSTIEDAWTAKSIAEGAGTHVALVQLSLSRDIDASLAGIGPTLAQLKTLGMISIVVIKGAGSIQDQVDRAQQLISAIEASGHARAQMVDQAFVRHMHETSNKTSAYGNRGFRYVLHHPAQLQALLKRGILPIVPCQVLCVDGNPKLDSVDAAPITVALARHLTQHCVKASPFHPPADPIILDRVIILDPVGGIPSRGPGSSPHVYINLAQEYTKIQADLKAWTSQQKSSDIMLKHLSHLNLLQDILRICPASSSGLITTPQVVAKSQEAVSETNTGPRVRTRRHKNILLRNLLTDKPVISSSLPADRTATDNQLAGNSTFVKRGMPVTVIPEITHSSNTSSRINLPKTPLIYDKRVDMNKLVQLIEASFRRKLDTQAYFDRLAENTACLIIAGDYDGCAILTRETSLAAGGRDVVYLDKFAVQPRWQGAGVGVADIIFKTMTEDCFPEGVCWRSRANNAVNKWYFERARGTWRLTDTQWTCFWTRSNPSSLDIVAYEDICRSVRSSWKE